MLTRKQRELLLFIDQYLKNGGVSPSFEEMKEALNLRSKSGVHRLILALEERGFLKRYPHRARALEVMRIPEGLAAARAGFAPNVIQGDFTARLPAARTAEGATAVSLPLYGRIAAGLPIEAIRDDTAHIEVPVALLGAGEHFALEVAGDSMIDAGILDGDIVLIRRTEDANTGEIVVALVDGQEVTLKRLRRRGQSIALEPANPRHEIRLFPADRVKVQGRLVALMRQY